MNEKKKESIIYEFFILASSFLYLLSSSTLFQRSFKLAKLNVFLPLICLIFLYFLFSKCKNVGIFTLSLAWSFVYIGMFFQIKSVLPKILSIFFLFTFPIFHYCLFSRGEKFNQKSIMFFAILSFILLAIHFMY